MKVEHWLDDLTSLFEVMRDNNPYIALKERILGFSWLNLKEGYAERLQNAESEMEYLEVFFDALQALQTGHADIITPGWLESY
ncbi:MAG: hypothetical protein ACXAEF_13590, partial [Candidatus Thorarchaeota archaeon]